VFNALTANRISGLQSYLDFVLDDVLSLSRVDYQEFNLFKSFTITNYPSGGKKRFQIREFVGNRDQMMGEIRQALQDKAKISLKVWLRVKNIENAVSFLNNLLETSPCLHILGTIRQIQHHHSPIVGVRTP
jgi:hypothetical protein